MTTPNHKHINKRLLAFLLAPATLQAVTVVRVDPTPVLTVAGNVPVSGFPTVFAVPGASIQVCVDSACVTPLTTYTDQTGSVACPNTAQVVLAGTNVCSSATDSRGNFGFWVPSSGWYKVTFTNQPAGSSGPFPFSTTAAGVTTFNGRSGAVVPVAGDYPVSLGGTGLTSATANGILYGNTASPFQVTAPGAQFQTLQAGSGGTPAFSALPLNQSAAVSGQLGSANGGTGVASPTAHTVPVAEGSSPYTFVGPGTSGQLLTSNGAAADPTFQTLSAASILPSGSQLQYLRIQPNTGNNTTSQFAALPQINMSDYAFPAQSCNSSAICSAGGASGMSLVIGNNSLTMTPVPLGVNGTDGGHYLYVSGGVGTAEACLITGGSGTSGQTSGVIIINCANTHTGSWTLQSATAGCGEATSATPNGSNITIGIGTFVFFGSCNFGPFTQFVGFSRGFLNSGQGTVIDARTVPTTLAAFQYFSPVMGSSYDIDSGIRFQDISMECFRCVIINNETIPSFQANVKNVIIYHVRMNGTYATASDPNRYAASPIPTLTQLRAFGTLISCNQCFDADFNNLELENAGLAVYLQNADINTIEGSTRFQTNAVNVWIDGNAEGSGTNKIINNDMLGNQRVPNIMSNATINLIVSNNYFEEYCPSGQFLRSVGSFGLQFTQNRIDDPANAALCVASGGPNSVSTTPILHLEDLNSDNVSGNFMNVGPGNIPPLEVAYTNWNNLRPNFVACLNNNQFFPCPNGQFQIPTGVFYALAPAVLSAPLNPYLVKPNNVASDSIQACGSTFANIWHQSAVLKQADNATFRWVLNTISPCAFKMKVQNQEFFNYLFQLTGRKIGTGAGATTIQYTDAAGTLTTLFNANLNFIATTEVETRSVLVQLPSTVSGPGFFTVTVDGSNAEFEQIEMIPQANGAPTSVYSTGSYTNATTTLSNITGLALNVSANANYTIDCMLIWQGSANTAGPKWAFTGPSTPTSVNIGVQSQVTATSITSGVSTAFGTSVNNAGTISATTNFMDIVRVGLINGANAGTVQLQAAANGAGTLTVQNGSWCKFQ